ncbi:carbon-nitrogen family hydrolase [Staphylococcus sp. FSL H8-0121]|uniref:carbon-nitrogen family hydrolase n=1 Tax=Staphylococcus sp. FSL H8-0121 TaxID=2921377 RepID=UPI0030F66C83
MKVQLFQIYIEYGQAEQNKTKIKQWFENELENDTDVVVLPEMWNNGYALEKLNELADKDLNDSLPFISNLSQTYQVDIIAGSVSNQIGQNIYNTAFSVLSNGKCINRYNKVHLVPMLSEPDFMSPGKQVPEPFELSDGTLATQIICYDLRFPELLRYPARSGAQIAFYVAQWPTVRLNHWLALLKARAIENDMFVVGTNSCGNDGQTDYAGHSIVINPNGEVIADLGSDESTLSIDIDVNEVLEQRQAIPVFDNLKLNLYK